MVRQPDTRKTSKLQKPNEREPYPPKSSSHEDRSAVNELTDMTAAAAIRQCPHVHVMGDLAELQIFRKHETLPDHVDSSLISYRKLRGFVKRALPGGAWSVAQFVRAALRCVWTLNTQWCGNLSTIRLDEGAQTNGLPTAASSNTGASNPNPASTVPWQSWAKGFFVVDSDTAGTTTQTQRPSELNIIRDFSWTGSADSVAFQFAPHFCISPETPFEPATVVVQSRGNSPIHYHDFNLGIVTSTLTESGKGLGTFCKFVTSDTATPSMVLWPRYSTIRLAIRQVDIGAIISKYDESKPVDLGDIRIQTIWDELTKDESEPLQTFLSPSLDHPTDENPDVKPCSRMVLLLDKNWCDAKKRVRIKYGAESRYCGYLIVRADRRDWDIWMSNFQIETPNLADVIGSRLQIDFNELSNTQETDERLFGVPITPAIARLVAPNKRPARDIRAPLAMVTASQFVDVADDLDDPDDPACSSFNPVQPIWEIAKSEKRDPEIYRLRQAEGYDWDEDWFPDIRNRREEYVRSDPNRPANVDANDPPYDRLQLSIIEWGLSHWHRHSLLRPQWVLPDAIHKFEEFKHLVIADLNFGFRRFSEYSRYEDEYTFKQIQSSLATAIKYEGMKSDLCKWFAQESSMPFSELRERISEAIKDLKPSEYDSTQGSAQALPDHRTYVGRPDWWFPLIKWSKAGASPDSITPSPADSRGWLIAILGRQLPLQEVDDRCDGCDEWDHSDLWHLLRHGSRPYMDGQQWSHEPLFRDRTVVVISGNLLRASGAMISHRLSWEHTAVDCLRELSLPKFRPLLEFRHLVIRFGCAGAIHIGRDEFDDAAGKRCERISRHLFYDATAKGGYHRDQARDGSVIGSNSAYAAQILAELLSMNSAGYGQEEQAIHRGIRRAMINCQQLYDEGYGTSFEEQDEYKIDYAALDKVMFNP